MNIHRELIKIGYQLTFEGIARMRPGTRYISVQYPESMRDELKTVVGETPYTTALSIPEELEPVALTQFYPAAVEDQWYVALSVMGLEAIYGFEEPLVGFEFQRLMRGLRNSSFHGPHVNSVLSYWKKCDGYFTKNPALMTTWNRNSTYFTIDKTVLAVDYVEPLDFIADQQKGFVLGEAPKQPVARPNLGELRPSSVLDRYSYAPVTGTTYAIGQAEPVWPERIPELRRREPSPRPSTKAPTAPKAPKAPKEPDAPKTKYGRLIILED